MGAPRGGPTDAPSHLVASGRMTLVGGWWENSGMSFEEGGERYVTVASYNKTISTAFAKRTVLMADVVVYWKSTLVAHNRPLLEVERTQKFSQRGIGWEHLEISKSSLTHNHERVGSVLEHQWLKRYRSRL